VHFEKTTRSNSGNFFEIKTPEGETRGTGSCTVGALGARGPSAQAGGEIRAARVPGASGRHVPVFAPTDAVVPLLETVPLPLLLPALAGSCADPLVSLTAVGGCAFPGQPSRHPAAGCQHLQGQRCCQCPLVRALVSQTVIPVAGDQQEGGGDPALGAAPCPSSRRCLQTLAPRLAISAHCPQPIGRPPLTKQGLLPRFSRASGC